MSKLPETSMTMIERMRNGEFSDLESWNKSLERYYAPVRQYVCLLLGTDSTECDDIVQDAFKRMWKKLQKDGFDRQRTGSFRTYFKQCINWAKSDFKRAKDRIKEELILNKPIDGSNEDNATEFGQLLSDSRQDPDNVTEEEKLQLIRCFLSDSIKRVVHKSHLRDEHRQIVNLIVAGVSMTTIAEKCTTTADNVRHIKSRLIAAVKEDLAKLASQEFLFSKEDLEYAENAKLLKSLCM